MSNGQLKLAFCGAALKKDQKMNGLPAGFCERRNDDAQRI